MKLAAGIVLVITGTIWALQGLGAPFAPQSFMTDDSQWVLWGSMTIGLGGGLIWSSRRSS